jgi:hypothetical protein
VAKKSKRQRGIDAWFRWWNRVDLRMAGAGIRYVASSAFQAGVAVGRRIEREAARKDH